MRGQRSPVSGEAKWKLVPPAVTASMLACVRNKAVHELAEQLRPHHGQFNRADTMPPMEESESEETQDTASSTPKTPSVPNTTPGPNTPAMNTSAIPKGTSGVINSTTSTTTSTAPSTQPVFRARLLSESEPVDTRPRANSDCMGDNIIAGTIPTDDGPVDPAEAIRRAGAPLNAAKKAVQETLEWFDTYVDACMRFLVSANVLALLRSILEATPTRTCVAFLRIWRDVVSLVLIACVLGCLGTGSTPAPFSVQMSGQLLSELVTGVESWHRDEFLAFGGLQPPRVAWGVLRILDPAHRTFSVVYNRIHVVFIHPGILFV